MAGPFLRRRGGTYSLRLRVPADLVPTLGRREVVRALGTACPRVARARAARLHLRVIKAWGDMRDMTEDATGDPRDELIRVLSENLELSEDIRRREADVAGMEATNARLRSAMEQIARARDLSGRVAAGCERLTKVDEGLVDIRKEVEALRQAGKLSPEALGAFRALLDTMGVTVRDRPTPTILEFLEETYIPERRLKDDAKRHVQGYVRLFAKAVGDRPLASYTRKHVTDWVRTLERVHVGYGKGGKDHGKDIRRILAPTAGASRRSARPPSASTSRT